VELTYQAIDQASDFGEQLWVVAKEGFNARRGSLKNRRRLRNSANKRARFCEHEGQRGRPWQVKERKSSPRHSGLLQSATRPEMSPGVTALPSVGFTALDPGDAVAVVAEVDECF
jgi:hypothetical protein